MGWWFPRLRSRLVEPDGLCHELFIPGHYISQDCSLHQGNDLSLKRQENKHLNVFPLHLSVILSSIQYNGTKPRNQWEMWHPTLVAEAVFAIANIFSSLRLISLFTANSHLGPLQISLGRMLLDILKFLFIYCLVKSQQAFGRENTNTAGFNGQHVFVVLQVLLAFANGLNQLYFYYETKAADERGKCKGIRCVEQNNAFST